MCNRIIIYSLREHNSQTILDYKFGLHIIAQTKTTLTISLPSGIKQINYWDYLNKENVYQDPENEKVFFLICTKQVKAKWALTVLLKFAINKTQSRIKNMLALIDKYQNEIVAA